ncbi:MAG: hypothetical protein JSV39_04975 [Candidatus Aenigmatarchaeota archaeon]|nr:MAG: hypothetical protein JSV39_04975 [Candidatus Aenigmarchaeota archaeon]
MAFPVVKRYRENVEKLIQFYSDTRDASIRGFYDNSVLDKTLQDSSCTSQSLLRRFKLKKLASFMTDSIVNENYREERSSIGEYFPLADLHNLVRLHQEKGIRPPKNTLQAICYLIDLSVSPTKESRYNLHRIPAGIMINVLDAVKKLDLASQFNTRYIDKLIERAHKEKNKVAAEDFERIKGEISLYKKADEIAESSSAHSIDII